MYIPFLGFQLKYPCKVHVCNGISCWGTTNIVDFYGIMIAACYGEIIKLSFVNFSLRVTILCRTMTQSTLPGMCKEYLIKGELTLTGRMPHIYYKNVYCA